MSIGSVIKIISWAIDKYENLKKFIIEKWKIVKARRIRNAIDKHDTGTIDSVVRDIKSKRQDKFDAT